MIRAITSCFLLLMFSLIEQWHDILLSAPSLFSRWLQFFPHMIIVRVRVGVVLSCQIKTRFMLLDIKSLVNVSGEITD